MRIFFTIAVISICSACTPEIHSFLHSTEQDIKTYSYKETFRAFFLGDEITPTLKQQQKAHLQMQCSYYSEKRVRIINGINDEAWYNHCPPAMAISTGPERIEMTKRPPYTTEWPAIRVNDSYQ
jgi:hypothetical protein